jgi:hypothetical protein
MDIGIGRTMVDEGTMKRNDIEVERDNMITLGTLEAGNDETVVDHSITPMNGIQDSLLIPKTHR